MMKTLITALIAACALFANTSLAKEPILIGAVESQADANALDSAPPTTRLRLAFEYKDGLWSSICKGKESSERNDGCLFEDAGKLHGWEIYSDGRDLGTIQTKGWRDSQYYSFTGALTIQTFPVPGMADSSDAFANFSGPTAHRPLVALSGAGSNSIKHVWGRQSPGAKDKSLAWPIFKAKVPSIPSCQFDDNGNPLGKSRRVVFSDMVVFDRVQLSDGSYLLGVRARQAQDCAESGGFASDFWLVKPATGAAFAMKGFDVDGWSYNLNLVDIGDFAGDGTLQALFYLAGYNEAGYVLYYDHFRELARFTWGYH